MPNCLPARLLYAPLFTCPAPDLRPPPTACRRFNTFPAGVVTLPFSVREGINIFLAGFVPTENLRFREEALTFKARRLGLLGKWGDGVLLGCWSGLLRCWVVGLLGCWAGKVLGCWGVGVMGWLRHVGGRGLRAGGPSWLARRLPAGCQRAKGCRRRRCCCHCCRCLP